LKKIVKYKEGEKRVTEIEMEEFFFWMNIWLVKD
jgi:hypothetical protein